MTLTGTCLTTNYIMLSVAGVTGKLYRQHISCCPFPWLSLLSLSLDVLSNDEKTLKLSEHLSTVTSEKWNSCSPGFGVGLLKGDYPDLPLWSEVMGSMSTSTRAVRTPPHHCRWALQGPFLSTMSYHVGWGHEDQGQGTDQHLLECMRSCLRSLLDPRPQLAGAGSTT